ncbi:MAG: alternative ribosome rescue aminoacyl-tRNA hydrolase ArfB [Pirellulales bacterium]
MLVVGRRIRLPLTELTFTYVRSSGPGGQNVNKVASKAVLRWQPATSGGLPEDVRERFLRRYDSRLTNAGELILTSDRYRDQGRNTADCLDKLRAMLAAVADPPKPRKRTKPSRASVERRLKSKQRAGAKKQGRRSPAVED